MTTTARDLRDSGQSDTLAADVAAHKGFGEYIREAIDLLADTAPRPWSCDMVRLSALTCWELDGYDRADFSPADNLLPAIIGGYVGSGRIVRVGERTSTRRSRRASRVGTYLGAKYAPSP